MSAATKLSSKFQISIPKEIREQQGWRAGQEFVFLPKGNSVVLVPVPERESLRGIAKGANPENYRDRNDRY
jgi:AbrB family looped-hinge helix DNA binding protein